MDYPRAFVSFPRIAGSGNEIAYYQVHNMQYIDLEIHALIPAVAPSPAACLGRERKEWRYCNFYI
jgi:hypothetical protein